MSNQTTSTCSAVSEDLLLPLDGLDSEPSDSAKSNPIAKPSSKSTGRKSLSARTSEKCEGGGQRIDLLTGGFPCQPFSYCGKRRGKNDNRNLWPEMLRIIKEQRPAWVIGENVAGIINMELDQVHSDLESEGYSVQTLLIPACAVGAIHRRNRAWIIANNNNIGMERGGEAKIFGVKKIQRNKNGGGFKELCGMPPISTPRIFRACDGVPGWVDRLKGLGNAIVPQVAYQIIKGIKEVMEQSDEN
jgi:DNA (cytosine-5)-methyltransferase 1